MATDEELTDQEYTYFQKTADRYKQNRAKFSATSVLVLDSLLKQVEFGDCNYEKPSLFKRDEYKKWKAWKKLEGMSMEEAIKSFLLNLSKFELDKDKTLRPKSGHYI